MDDPADADSALIGAERGENIPHLALDGFVGPLDHLLALARAQTIDLGRLSLTALLDQLALALQRAPATTALGQKADWVVMAAWLVQLRARLLLPPDMSAQQNAAAEAGALRHRLVALDDAQALAGWLERRPQLGHDGFARGRPEAAGVSVEGASAIDVVEFLWASMALFKDAAADTAAVYRPVVLDLYAVGEARDRMRQLLAAMPHGAPLERFLPEPETSSEPRSTLQWRSAWASTFIAGLELAKEGAAVMEQGREFQPIHVAAGKISRTKNA